MALMNSRQQTYKLVQQLLKSCVEYGYLYNRKGVNFFMLQ